MLKLDESKSSYRFNDSHSYQSVDGKSYDGEHGLHFMKDRMIDELHCRRTSSLHVSPFFV